MLDPLCLNRLGASLYQHRYLDTPASTPHVHGVLSAKTIDVSALHSTVLLLNPETFIPAHHISPASSSLSPPLCYLSSRSPPLLSTLCNQPPTTADHVLKALTDTTHTDHEDDQAHASEVEKHKQDSLSKQKEGKGYWKPELASNSEASV